MGSHYDIISKYYLDLGGPGSFAGFEKLKMALKLDGHRIADNEIKAALKNIKSYQIYRNKYHPRLPRHVPKRFAQIFEPDEWWYGDSMYILKGWTGIYRFVQVWVDGFTKQIFARPLAKLTSENSVKVFQSICQTENKGVYPKNIYVDRGSEWLGSFQRFTKEVGIKQVFTSAAQKNKSFFAERAIRTIRKMLKRVHVTGEHDLSRALKGVIASYNSSIHSTIKTTPDKAEENVDHVRHQLQLREEHYLSRYLREFQKLNNIFKIGDLVRYKLPKPVFAKETDDYFSEEVYRISKIKPSTPMRGYQLSDLNSDFIQPGTFTADQLMLVYKQDF